MDLNDKVQKMWREQQIFRFEGVMYGDGKVTLTQETRIDYDSQNDIAYRLIEPIVDSNFEAFERYTDPCCDYKILDGSFIYENQKIVFGDCWFNCGFVASTSVDNYLNWSIFFDDKKSIVKAEIISEKDKVILACKFEDYHTVYIDFNTLHNMKIL